MGKNDIVKLDKSGFEQTLAKLIREVPLDAGKVIMNESRLLVEDLVDRTKPVVGKLKKRIKGTVLRAMIPSKSPAASSTVSIPAYRAARSKQQKAPVLVVPAAIRKLIAEQSKHIGWFAAGWLGSGNPLGAKKGVPGNVKKHPGQGKTQVIKIPFKTRVTVTNASRFIDHIPGLKRKMVQILNAAFKTRAYKMQKNLNMIRGGVKKYKVAK